MKPHLQLAPAYRKVVTAIAYVLVTTLLIASVGTAILGRPLLLEVERSNSMYPLLQRGDVVLVLPVKTNSLHTGDIVMFKTPTGQFSVEGWIVHRIVGGNAETGFFTQGDANPYSDQALGASAAIQPAWIVNRIPTLAGHPLKIPYLGYLSLWASTWSDKLYVFPISAVVVAIFVGFTDRNKLRRKKSAKIRRGVQQFWLLMLSGVVLSIATGALILNSSSRLVLTYAVAQTQGVLNGSPVGVIETGQTVTQPLATLSTRGVLPTVAVLTTKDPQVTLQPSATLLTGRAKQPASMEVQGLQPGTYRSVVWIGLFPPLLPPEIIHGLAKTNFWLAFALVSALPSLPFLFYPWLNPRIRQQTLRGLRKQLRMATRVRG